MSRYALLLSAGPDRVGTALNAIEYVLSLDEAGHTVAVYLDGPATQWPGELETRLDHPLSKGLAAALDREIIAGCCAFCADAFGGTEGCIEAGIPLLGAAGEEHGPNVAHLVDDGYELLTVG